MGGARSVEFLAGHKIAVELDNGSSFIYDLAPKLDTIRFAALKDTELFGRGTLVRKDHIRWTDTLVIYVHEMLDGMKRT